MQISIDALKDYTDIDTRYIRIISNKYVDTKINKAIEDNIKELIHLDIERIAVTFILH